MIPIVTYTDLEREFIKRNSRTLKGIFQKDLDWITDRVFENPEDEVDLKAGIKFRNYFKDWLNQLNILDEKPKGDKKTDDHI